MVDSVLWRCAGCGGEHIGGRTPDDLCTGCIAVALTRPADPGVAALSEGFCPEYHHPVVPVILHGGPQRACYACCCSWSLNYQGQGIGGCACVPGNHTCGEPTLRGLYQDIIDTAGTPLMHAMVHAAAKLIGEGRFDGAREVPGRTPR